MTLVSVVFVFILGILLGLLLFLTVKGQPVGKQGSEPFVASVVNIFRAIPFILLIILLIPFTYFLVGTMIGKNAALPASVIGPLPFTRGWLKSH